MKTKCIFAKWKNVEMEGVFAANGPAIRLLADQIPAACCWFGLLQNAVLASYSFHTICKNTNLCNFGQNEVEWWYEHGLGIGTSHKYDLKHFPIGQIKKNSKTQKVKVWANFEF